MKRIEGNSLSVFLKALRLSPNYYAFLGGIFISSSINLFTGVFSADTLPKKWTIILFSAALHLISAFSWSIIAWDLDSINDFAYTQTPGILDELDVWLDIVRPRVPKFILYFSLAFVSACIGFFILIL